MEIPQLKPYVWILIGVTISIIILLIFYIVLGKHKLSSVPALFETPCPIGTSGPSSFFNGAEVNSRCYCPTDHGWDGNFCQQCPETTGNYGKLYLDNPAYPYTGEMLSNMSGCYCYENASWNSSWNRCF